MKDHGRPGYSLVMLDTIPGRLFAYGFMVAFCLASWWGIIRLVQAVFQ